MRNLPKVLEEAVGEASVADQEDLLNFIRAKSAELTVAQDATAIETILNTAVSAKSIKQAEKDILFAAVKKYLAIDTQSNQSGSQTDAKDPTKIGKSTNNQPAASEVTSGNTGQPASSPISKKSPDSIISTVDKSEAEDIPKDNMKKSASSPPPDSVVASWTSSSGATAIMNAGSYTAITTGGWLWLLTLYLGATWLAVGSLSSIQFRGDIEPKYKVTLNEILGILEKKNLQLKIEQYRDKKYNEALDWDNHLKDIVIAIDNQPETLNSFLDTMSKARCDNPETMETCKELGKVLKNYLPHLKKKQSNEDELQKAIETYEKNNKAQGCTFVSTNENISKTQEGAPASEDKAQEGTSKTESKLDDLQAGIGFMLKFHYGDFLKMPVQVLTLLLAIAMGVLGSTITMTWSFLDERTNLPLRWYLLRPFVGALSALVIFIFAKAGQMSLITDAANTTLSPFLLSLLGIAAGLLSDRAYAQMSSVSGKFLGNMGAEQERWSSHIKEELKKQNMTSEALATALNLDKHRIDEIIAGVRMASLQEQRRISDRLGIAPRLLFTDIAP